MSFNNCVIWNNTDQAFLEGTRWKTSEMKEKKEYVPLMDVSSNLMILVEKKTGEKERGEREGKEDEMDRSVGEGMNRG